MNKYKTIALIVAAGRGHRAGGDLPKQYQKIAGETLLHQSILSFTNHELVDAVQVVYNHEDKKLYEETTKHLNVLPVVAGGDLRQDSVRIGLNAIKKYQPEKVLIHDAARPLVSYNIISNVLREIKPGSAAIPTVPVEDTLKKCNNGKIIHTVNREDLMRAQTPQGFIYDDILKSHANISHESFTDDAAIYEHLGYEVATVEGSQLNFKITTKEDFVRAENLMRQNMKIRIGTGFDVHKFCKPTSKDNYITICGVPISYNKSLEGHSDADVGLHAVVDSLLGAASLGDIGEHFPPSDNKYKNADSSIFLKHTKSLLDQNNAQISNIDVTIICQEPKISPYKKDMVAKIAQILQICPSCISVKATTTEGLGFTGRKEGIAAQASSLILMR